MKFKISNKILFGIEFDDDSELNNLVIPDGVEAIAPNVFARRKIGEKITSVVFPNSLKRIGQAAFYGQTKLSYIKFPKSLKSIASDAFRGIGKCDIEILPEYNNKDLSKTRLLIDDNAFSCSQILSIKIAAQVSLVLGDSAFFECKELKDVDINIEKMIEIDEHCFEGCINLNHISIKGNLKSIPRYCFTGCCNMTKFDFGLTQIIDNGAFSMSGLTQIYFSKSIKEIKDSAFSECKKLTSVKFDSEATDVKIGKEAFIACNKLEYFDFNPVIDIGQNAFTYNSKLKKIVLGKTRLNINSFRESGIEEADVSNATTIPVGCFSMCQKLKKIALPSAIKIGQNAFAFCSNLKELIIPEGVEFIDCCAFSPSGLESVVFPSSLIHIGESAFWGSRLKNADFSCCIHLATIEDFAFQSTSLREVNLRNCALTNISVNLAFEPYIKICLPYQIEDEQ